jgi:O-acetyl-ADP-ribose deacetylase (regulator of RNase III)
MASLRTLPEIPTLSRLYQSRVVVPSPTPVVSAPSQVFNNIISHISYDVTKLQVDCIVNAANTSLLGGGGVDAAIHGAAGRDLVNECRTLGGCQTGDAKITDAYRLPCKKVIHAVGPIYDRALGQSERLLRGCYRRSLQLAVENGLRSIAFSAISTGVYGYPSNEAAKVAISEVRDFLASDENVSELDRVVFCSFMPKDVLAYECFLP